MKRTGFKNRGSSLARVSKNPANKRLRANKRKSKADMKREWGINPTYKLRYESPVEKGILWYWFARYIRMRDFVNWGRCISCNEPKTFEQLQAGHFVPAGYCGLGLLFDEKNNNGECEGCNGFDGFHLIGYKRNLATRYGNEVVENLEYRRDHRHADTTKFSRLEYLQMAGVYQQMFTSLLAEETV